MVDFTQFMFSDIDLLNNLFKNFKLDLNNKSDEITQVQNYIKKHPELKGMFKVNNIVKEMSSGSGFNFRVDLRMIKKPSSGYCLGSVVMKYRNDMFNIDTLNYVSPSKNKIELSHFCIILSNKDYSKNIMIGIKPNNDGLKLERLDVLDDKNSYENEFKDTDNIKDSLLKILKAKQQSTEEKELQKIMYDVALSELELSESLIKFSDIEKPTTNPKKPKNI